MTIDLASTARPYFGQSFKMGEYMTSYLNKPYLRDFVTKKNQRYVEITKYVHEQSGETVSPDEFKVLTLSQQRQYEEKVVYTKILTATISGFNSRSCCGICR